MFTTLLITAALSLPPVNIEEQQNSDIIRWKYKSGRISLEEYLIKTRDNAETSAKIIAKWRHVTRQWDEYWINKKDIEFFKLVCAKQFRPTDQRLIKGRGVWRHQYAKAIDMEVYYNWKIDQLLQNDTPPDSPSIELLEAELKFCSRKEVWEKYLKEKEAKLKGYEPEKSEEP